jgi:nucleoside-diphosphate-sugar epimerase
MSKVLITGGMGAIGKNVAAAAINKGFDVVVLDDFSSAGGGTLDKKVKVHKGSIEDNDLVQKLLKDSVEYVIHLAALFANQNSVDNPRADLSTNGLGSLNVAQMSAQVSVKRVVYASSSCVYQNSNGAMSEKSEVGGFDTPYALTKYLGEKYFELYGHLDELNYSIVRIFNSYGPYELPGKYRNVIPNFLKLAIDREPLPILGTGNETRDFTYVTDIAEGILLALITPEAKGEIFNLGNGKETSVIDLANAINQITGSSAGVEFRERRNWDHVTKRLSNIDKAKAILNYSPKVSFENGLANTYEWLKAEVG